ncbi:reticulon-1-like isoform X2 [Photinus pyralis]|nr:reticulon-1-like isoform X2 [Photinus pyralis]
MDNKDFITNGRDRSPGELPQIRREKDSLDDFEHLGLDNSPLQESLKEGAIGVSKSADARDVLGGIDKALDLPVTKVTDDDIFDPLKKEVRMDSNLLEMGDSAITDNKQEDEKLDRFLSELTSAPTVPSHDVSPFDNEHKILLDGFKSATQSFMELERGDVPAPVKTSTNNDDDRYETYNDPEVQEAQSVTNVSAKTPVDHIPSDFHTEIVKEDEITPPVKSNILESVPEVKKVEKLEAPIPEQPPTIQELPRQVTPEPKKVEQVASVEAQQKPAITDAEAIFKKMGLVESLIYWRDPKKSGPVFGGFLVVLLALTYLSLISVVAYVSLLALTATISFRIYKNIVHAVQKTGDGHPFKEFLETDLSLPQEKVKEVVEVAIAHINGGLNELRRLFLVEDLVDSIKFAVLLWCLTYLGAWFNGMTLVIIAWVALFTLPKLYETNKTQIDANLDLVRSKVAEITSKVKGAIPIGKKVEEKKEQ